MLNNKALGLIFPNSFDAHVARMGRDAIARSLTILAT